MKFQTVEEIINYAYEKEKEAAEFYEKAKNDETFAAIKEVFENFEVEERKHQAMLKGFSKDQKKLATYKLMPVTDLKISDYMTEITYKQGMGYPDLLRLAMKREEQAYNFYKNLGDQIEDEKLCKVFKVLAQEEAKHKNVLETKYDDFLASQGM